MDDKISTLVELIDYWAEKKPDEILYTFLTGIKGEENTLSYRELKEKSITLAGYLTSILSPPARALILISPGLEYIEAFFGCLYAGITPVPLYPPQMNSSLKRLDDVIADCEAEIVLVDAYAKKAIVEYKDTLSRLKSAHLIVMNEWQNFSNQAFNGAEPVRQETLEQFAKVFARAGFSPTAFYPCYGLAEATLLVSGKKQKQLASSHKVNREQLEQLKVVSDGQPIH